MSRVRERCVDATPGVASQAPTANLIRVLAFRYWFGLFPAEARTLAALHAAQGGVLREPDLARLAEVSEGTLRVHICGVRSAMDAEAVDFVRGQGYSLTEVGAAECNAALAAIAADLPGAHADHFPSSASPSHSDQEISQ